jgi:hypothetical protein
MRTILFAVIALFTLVATYVGVRRYTQKDLAFSPVYNWLKGTVSALLHTEQTAAAEAGPA